MIKFYRTLKVKRKWLVLTAVVLCAAMLNIDQTAISVMLPQLKLAFNSSYTTQQWVMNSYFLTVAVLITIGGRCIDLFGVRKAFLFSAGGFLIASIVCGLAINIECLLIGRILQGMFNAVLLTSLTVNIVNAFPIKQAPAAMGLYIGTASIFLVLGPLLGGVLTQFFSWRYVFLLNIPLALGTLLAGNFIRGHKKNRCYKKTNSFDWLGVIVLGIANTALVFALTEGEEFGWASSLITSLFALAITSYFLFFKIEKTTAFPIVDFTIFKNKQYFVVTMVLFCMQFCIVTRIFLAITFQLAFGKTPTIAGLLVFPATLPIIFMAPVAGILLGYLGLRKVLYTGMLCVLTSFIWLVFFLNPDNYILLFMGLLLFGISFPLAMTPSVAISITSIEQAKRGMASGIVNQLRQLATTFGIAVFGAVTTHFGEYNYIAAMKEKFPKLTTLQHLSMNDVLINPNLIGSKVSSLGSNDLSVINQIAAKSYLSGFRLSILITIAFIIVAIILVWKTLAKDTSKSVSDSSSPS